jgi:hypothetical protein
MQTTREKKRERERKLRSHLNERIGKRGEEEEKTTTHLLSLVFVVVGKFIVSSIKG